MTSIVFVLSGLVLVLRRWKLSIITKFQVNHRFKNNHKVINMTRIPTHRSPTHPGEMLLEEFLLPLCLSQRDLAYAIHVPYQRVNEIVNRRRGITPSTALRLARFFSTSADFWMNLQQSWDLYHAQLSENDDLQTIQPLKVLSAG
jgi:antitoxin HigA-1